ncbi:MAG: hypothetical protein VW891_07160, partial [Novosphingobium sp.]
MAGPYGQGSAEAVAAKPMLPKPADRVAGELYRKMQKMDDGEVEVVVRTFNNEKKGVQYCRACFKCGNRS